MINKCTPCLVAFCGMDGSGKSTLINKLAKYFEAQDCKVKVKHAHGYSLSKNSFALQESSIHRLKWFFALLTPFAILDNLFTYWLKYKKESSNSIYICDRYFYDKLARLVYYGVCNKFFASLYIRILPKPKYIFFLDVEPTKAHLRKPEHTVQEFTRYREIYRFLAKKINSPIINTNVLLTNSFDEIISHVK